MDARITFEKEPDGTYTEVRTRVEANGDVLEFRMPFAVSDYFDYWKDNDKTIN
jgi:hypothetical protein